MVVIHLYGLIQGKGWTQRRLAEECNIRESTVSDMCNNAKKMLSIKHLNKICEVLHCRIEDIVEYIPDDIV